VGLRKMVVLFVFVIEMRCGRLSAGSDKEFGKDGDGSYVKT
jgi:hypothetical protein